MSYRIVFVGAGNLATRLSVELKRNGYVIDQVYSRTKTSALRLASILGAAYTTFPEEIFSDADIYFIALKDSAVDEVLPRVNFKNKLVVHCSGSLELNSLSPYSENIGVLYPLQTFSKYQEVDFKKIPVFIEGNSKQVEAILLNIAERISENISVLDSEKRLYLHIAAVFACNFVNHCYAIASEVLKANDMSFGALHSLIAETASRALILDPKAAQTGPAVRYDHNIINKHLKALEAYPPLSLLYKEISESILNFHKYSSNDFL